MYHAFFQQLLFCKMLMVGFYPNVSIFNTNCKHNTDHRITEDFICITCCDRLGTLPPTLATNQYCIRAVYIQYNDNTWSNVVRTALHHIRNIRHLFEDGYNPYYCSFGRLGGCLEIDGTLLLAIHI